MGETLLDRFLKIRNYSDINEVERYLNAEAERINKRQQIGYMDMLDLSMLSDCYSTNVPEDIQNKLIEDNGGKEPDLVGFMLEYRNIEDRLTCISDWSCVAKEDINAERARKYIWGKIEEYHRMGWDVSVSTVSMEHGVLDEYGTLLGDEGDADLDEFEADLLICLMEIFDNWDEERSLQLFFGKHGEAAETAFILVNCLWDEDEEGDLYCTPGPFIVSGTGKNGIALLAPEDIGLPVLSEGGMS